MKPIKNIRLALMAGAAVFALAACDGVAITTPDTTTPTPTPTPGPTPTPTADIDLVPDTASDAHANLSVVELTTTAGTVEIMEIAGAIESNLTLEADVAYYLSDTVFVGNDAGSTATTGLGVNLTIPAGTKIYGSGDTASLVVSRGSTINALGSASAPVIFTSLDELLRENGVASAGNADQRGEWGGLILNGFAPINVCDTSGDAVADGGCEKEGEAGSGSFGGDDASDSSGTLRYVRIEHGGIILNESNEANGIALQGVGSGTLIDYVHIHNNLDDGIEFFGGTVSASHIVVSGQSDDAIDWTDGWTGSVQHAVVVPGSDLRDDVYGIEGDNFRPNDLLPRSNPVLSNITIVGNDEWVAGARFRRGTGINFVNSIVVGAPFGLDIDDSATYDLFAVGSSISSVLFDNSGAELRDDGDIPATFIADQFDADNNVVTTTGNSLTNGVLPGPVELGVPATDVSGFGLEAVSHIGAFSATDTLESNWAAGWTKAGTVFSVEAASCPADTINAGLEVDGKIVCDVPAIITSDLTLSNGANLIYRLTDATFVGTDGGSDVANAPGTFQATLTIDPGVTVYAQAGAEAYLVVTRGSKILSNGSAAAPVRLTAEEALTGALSTPVDEARGYWGGLIINGKAPINVCDTSGDAVADGSCEKTGEFGSGTFGGDTVDDNSGSVTYTRVEYAGVIVNESNEANGIALQGVGSGTTIDYVQIHNNLDDGVEFFGGTVDAKHIVVTGQSDDAIDWTDGWTGRVQYAIVEPGTNLRDDAYGIEGDNFRPNDLLPRSNPLISNFTIIGNDEWVAGARLRRGSAATLANGIIVGATRGFDIDDASTYALFDDGTSELASILVDNLGDELRDDGDIPATFIADHFDADNNIADTANSLSGFSFFGNATGVVPGAAEAAVTATDMSAVDAFFDATPYIGAVEDADDKWYLGWTIDSTGAVTSAN